MKKVKYIFTFPIWLICLTAIIPLSVFIWLLIKEDGKLSPDDSYYLFLKDTLKSSFNYIVLTQ